MQKLKLISLILSLSFLNACNSPEIRDLTQKNLRLVLEDCGERRCIVEEESACFSRAYRHSESYIGSVGQDQSHDISFCNDVIGYDSAEYVELSGFFEAVRVKVTKKKRKGRKRRRSH